jgi:hypothetical protein
MTKKKQSMEPDPASRKISIVLKKQTAKLLGKSWRGMMSDRRTGIFFVKGKDLWNMLMRCDGGDG